ncbi:MAG TPA: hypothetical protein VJ203_05295 [Bacteroidales bacterium]|nr:hypothetical protein [Bacteroidales bacterium]
MKTRLKRNRLIGIVVSLFVLILLINSCEIAEDIGGINATVAKLEGEWTCDEESEFFKATKEIYTVYISPDADNYDGIIIDGFYNLGDLGLKATLSGKTVTIPLQTLSGDFTVTGSGIISSNLEEIEWAYNVDDGSGVIDHVTALYSKN